MSANEQIPQVVRTWLRAVRLPLTVTEAALRRNGDWAPSLAFEGFQANVKHFVGSVTRNRELIDQGRLEQAKMAEHRKALELETTAEQKKATADAAFEGRRQADEQRRHQAADEAAARERTLERETKAKRQRASAEAERKAEAAQQAEAATDKALTRRERSARSTKVATESHALRAERQSVNAKKAVASTDKQLEAAKRARRAGEPKGS